MEFTHPTAPLPALRVDSFLEGVKFSPAELKAITATRKALDGINRVIVESQPDNGAIYNHQGFLHGELNRTYDKLVVEPTKQNAEALHTAKVRFDLSGTTASLIGEALAIALTAESLKLAPIALRVVAEARSAFEADAAKHRAMLVQTAASGHFGGDEVRLHDERVPRFLTEFGHEEEFARRDPAGWLDSRGLALE